MKVRSEVLGQFWFWLLITTLHKLFSIYQPPLEAGHNWRQTTVTMVARNFLEVDANIFFPRVDMAGELSGITGMEFPLLNYLIYLVSVVFGYDHWYGRLINLVVTNLGVWQFYLYLKSTLDQKRAFAISMVLLFSLFYYYSRKIMPDTFSIALIFIGINQWRVYANHPNFLRFTLGSVLIGLGVLSKLPSVVVLAFLWPVFISSTNQVKVKFAAALLICGAAAGAWYFYWVPLLETRYGFHHFYMGSGFRETAGLLMLRWMDTLHMFYHKALGYAGFAAFVIGLLVARKWSRNIGLVALFSCLLMAVFMLKSGLKFTNHEYYIMPFVPLMAMVAGLGLAELPKKWFAMLLIVIAAEGVFRKWEDQFIKTGKELASLDAALAPYVDMDDLIVVNSGQYPTPLYFAHRKGWITENTFLADADYMHDLKSRGCKYALVLKLRFGQNVALPYPLVEDNQTFALYRL